MKLETSARPRLVAMQQRGHWADERAVGAVLLDTLNLPEDYFCIATVSNGRFAKCAMYPRV